VLPTIRWTMVLVFSGWRRGEAGSAYAAVVRVNDFESATLIRARSSLRRQVTTIFAKSGTARAGTGVEAHLQ
jgi:N-acetylglutamate synthase/N-acetylornithine aminotransferase